MLAASTDQLVFGYLGRALSLELSAIQLYTTQSRLAATWGLDEVAGKLRAEAAEELGHVERIIGRMLAVGVAPNASQLRPVKPGQNLRQLLEHDYAFEMELISLYEDAVQHCSVIGDQDNCLLFETLLEEEREHGQSLAKWLRQIS